MNCSVNARRAAVHSTGNAMPQNGMNIRAGRREPGHNTSRANGLMNGQVPDTDLGNGAVVHNDFPAAATRTSESTPAGTPNGTRPQCMVNGYINHAYKGKSTKALPPGTLRKQRRTISAVTDTSAAGRVGRGGTPGGILVNGATSLDTSPSSDQMAPKPSLSAAVKNQRRDTDFAHPENPILQLMPPQEGEDWEKEIQEATVTNWENMCFAVQPYGPEDVLHFTLRDLTLQQRDPVDLLVTANYSPSAHHPHPVKWSCCRIPTEPDQFADAD
ncbi:hypothetical protein PAMP_020915 [Pampus punctatissimus]